MTKHLYIHIPFCHQICKFCDFKRIKTLNNDKRMKNYVDKVLTEVKESSCLNQYKTIYLGGGTPNFLDNKLLNKLLSNLKKYLSNKNYEFTIECNPDLITSEQAIIFKKNKINRVSIGVQTTNNQRKEILEKENNSAKYKSLIIMTSKDRKIIYEEINKRAISFVQNG